MKNIQTILLRIHILNKRLLKKPAFLIILLLVPSLVFGVALFDKEDSGALTIALTAEDPDDPIAAEITSSLDGSSKLIRFVMCSNAEEAYSLVKNGTVDSAWIFHESLEEKIDKFTGQIHNRNAFVTVIQREETVLLQLSREKLYAALYPYEAFSVYKNYLIDELSEIPTLSVEDYHAYYDAINAPGGDLFEFSYADPTESTEDAQNMSYLLAPMRGLLSVLIILGGLAASMFYMQDAALGKFDWIPEHSRPLFAAIYHFIAIFDVVVVSLIAILVSGISVSLHREILLLVLYVILSTGFCLVVMQLCKNLHTLGAVIPVLIVLMIALCPVFFNVNALRAISYFLPPFYYLNAVHNVNFIPPMLVCTLAVYTFFYLCYRLAKR